MKITERTVKEHISALRAGEYSARELTLAYLEKIEETEPQIDAFLTVEGEKAIAAAQRADRMIARGEALPLCGIPFGVKDNISTEGTRTTCASKMLESYTPPYDATVIERLRGQGAVIIGKTNMDEFAMGSTTENSAFKITKNPIDRRRTPGGSSGGSAAAVAAGEVPFALGSDTGGSIRLPASFCGCVGLSPTYGAVSRYGLIAFASSLDRIGPMTKNCYDNALVFSAICQKDERDQTTLDSFLSPEECLGGVKGLRIGIAEDFFTDCVSDSVKSAVLSARDTFLSLGAEIVPVRIKGLAYSAAAYYIISSAEASSNLARYDGIRFGYRTDAPCSSPEELYKKSRSEGFGKEVKRRIMLGTYVLSEGSYENYYKKALKVRELLLQDYERAFEKCDIILSPTAPCTAYGIGEKSDDPVRLYTEDFLCVSQSLAGLPALSLPCGKDSYGLPIGLQLTGPRLSEKLLYRAGIAFEEVRG